MNDSCSRWNNLEFIKCALPPTKEAITLTVAFIFNICVLLKGILRSKDICNNRVINNELSWSKWIDLRWVSPEVNDRLAHRCKIYNARNSCEILHDNTCWSELNFSIWLHCWIPLGKCLNVIGGDVGAIFSTEKIFEKYFE